MTLIKGLYRHKGPLKLYMANIYTYVYIYKHNMAILLINNFVYSVILKRGKDIFSPQVNEGKE